MNDIDITQSLDTIKALSKVKFEGIVTDNNNVPLTNFNGTLSTTIFDKTLQKTTLDNDGFGIKMTYESQESKLFRGKSSVENGRFTFDFIVPKDIRVAFWKRKQSFYSAECTKDKSGFKKHILI